MVETRNAPPYRVVRVRTVSTCQAPHLDGAVKFDRAPRVPSGIHKPSALERFGLPDPLRLIV